MNAELSARIYFLYMGAYLSSIDKTVSVNSANSALLLSILNSSLFNSSFGSESFIISVVNGFWFLFLVEDFKIVITIFRKSKIPASIVIVLWKHFERFFKNKSMQDGLSVFLRHVGSLAKFERL